ncbi:hypothetical protein [Paenibacillus odorifer]|uniref:Uncharacterized protein n=1 Tax=Paenibacillus odorifer TaxID=189426 RepID=A0AAD0P2M7_9BACL|nr:hypothetical protein [Paenibacillus odorifer]AWV35172.1 hypothetical protein CD191_22445 [Paenibacillus odorifer]
MTEETEEKKKKSEKVSFWPMIVFVVLVLGLWLGNMFGGLYGFKPDDNASFWGDRGTFGDMFGAVNALFSGLAFAGLIFTIILQRKDLKLQFKELSRQADEAEKMAKQLEIQQQLTSYQLAQSTVNDLIRIKNFTINQYGYYWRADDTNFKDNGMNALNGLARQEPQIIENETKNNQTLSQYCSVLFYILEYLIDSNLNEQQRKVLAKTLQLQLTRYELKIMQIYAERDMARLKLWDFFNKATVKFNN